MHVHFTMYNGVYPHFHLESRLQMYRRIWATWVQYSLAALTTEWYRSKNPNCLKAYKLTRIRSFRCLNSVFSNSLWLGLAHSSVASCRESPMTPTSAEIQNTSVYNYNTLVSFRQDAISSNSRSLALLRERKSWWCVLGATISRTIYQGEALLDCFPFPCRMNGDNDQSSEQVIMCLCSPALIWRKKLET